MNLYALPAWKISSFDSYEHNFGVALNYDESRMPSSRDDKGSKFQLTKYFSKWSMPQRKKFLRNT